MRPTYHQHGDRRSNSVQDDLVDAARLNDLLAGGFEPNRWQRRDYVRRLQTRQVLKYTVGFGRWRRHDAREYESQAALTALSEAEQARPPRALRRRAAIRAARVGRKLRLQQERGA